MNTNPHCSSQRTACQTGPQGTFGHESRAVLASIGVSAAALVGTLIIGAVVGWSQRSIAADPREGGGGAPLLASGKPVKLYPTAQVTHGRDLFATTCVACHGEDGRGRPGLGKDLTTSDFVRANPNTVVRDMIKAGRAADDKLNTTKIAMPPKGGNFALSDAEVDDIAIYIRALQNPQRVAAGVSLLARVEVDEAAIALAAAAPADIEPPPEDWYPEEMIALGAKHYAASCVSCHGPDARGVKGLGLDLVASKFCNESDDDELIAFLFKGRPASDPANVTKVDMPPKGGNPALNEEKLEEIVAYVRELQRRDVAAKQ